jgi:hypothetical protein
VALLFVLLVVLAGSLIGALPLLPERVATHFNAAGIPDGWMNRTGHLIAMAVFGFTFPLAIIGICWAVQFMPASIINIPHRDYWLADDRRAESTAYLFRHSIWLGCLSLGFITSLHWAVVFSNQRQPVQLPLYWILGLAGLYLAGVVVWIYCLYRRFQLPATSGVTADNSSATLVLFFVFSLVGLGLDARANDRPGTLPMVVAVEGQPLAANVIRVTEALQTLGAPLPANLIDSLKAAVQARDAQQLQKLLDPLVLFVVNINPETRVKVARGPAPARLQQFGFTPVLIKVVNDSTATRRLRILSPQSGAVYAGVARLSMQRQQSLELRNDENTSRSADRFLSVAMHDQPPLLDRLSGLEVEYAIALILSTESGKREATIGFDMGDSEQDLGARGETAVLFQVEPAIPVRLSVRDADGSPTTAALVIQDRAGGVYPPQAKRLAPDLFFQPQIYRADGETVLLPPGEFILQSGRGPEYWVRKSSLVVSPDGAVTLTNPEEVATPSNAKRTADIQLDRWVNPRDFGFYSGDHHIHAAGCAHYTSPTEGVTPEDMFRQVKGEALNVGCVLTWGPCYRFQRQFFASRPHDISEPLTLLKYDLEISGFGSQAFGHVCLLNLKDQTYPGSDETETKGWPLWTTPVMRWAKEQGGVTGYAHSASGLAIDPPAAARRKLARMDANDDGVLSNIEAATGLLPEPFAAIDRDGNGVLDLAELTESHNRAADRLPNLAIPEMNGVGAMEVCVTVAEGVCDFISAMDTRRIQEWNTWYHILNCGFPLKVSGETDFPCMSSRRVGQGRVYVQLDPGTPLDFAAWCENLAKGRSYVSDGFAHALDFKANGHAPGLDALKLPAGGTVSITAKVAFAPQTPETVAQGVLIPREGLRLVGDTVELHGPRTDRLVTGGKRLVEIVMNGQPVASANVPADGRLHELKFDINVTRSSWIALRHFPQLHTNPINIIVADKPIRASRDSARWCDEVIELLWKNRHKVIPEAERPEALRIFEKARDTYRRIEMESE